MDLHSRFPQSKFVEARRNEPGGVESKTDEDQKKQIDGQAEITMYTRDTSLAYRSLQHAGCD